MLGSASVNYSDKAFWSDVLTSPYFGFTDAYTMVNGSFGVKWMNGKVTTLVKVTNLFNQDIQQHVFGDILKRSVSFEVRIKRSRPASAGRGRPPEGGRYGRNTNMPGRDQQAAVPCRRTGCSATRMPAARNWTVRILSPSAS